MQAFGVCVHNSRQVGGAEVGAVAAEGAASEDGDEGAAAAGKAKAKGKAKGKSKAKPKLAGKTAAAKAGPMKRPAAQMSEGSAAAGEDVGTGVAAPGPEGDAAGTGVPDFSSLRDRVKSRRFLNMFDSVPNAIKTAFSEVVYISLCRQYPCIGQHTRSSHNHRTLVPHTISEPRPRPM